MASIERRKRGDRVRWYARYRDSDGIQRARTFDRKIDAERFVTMTAADVLRGTYIDPDAGQVPFAQYATAWLETQTFEESTRQATELRLRLHVFPTLGDKRLSEIKPSTIQAWLSGLTVKSAGYRRVIFANLSTILAAAVDDERIAKNPCRAGSVRPPKAEARKISPWPAERVLAVRDAISDRYRIAVTLAAGLGLRQGEVFGLSPNDVDFLRGTVEIRRQVRLYASNRQVFALPKGGKTRTVPLPSSVRDALAEHLVNYPACPVDLPWAVADGERTTIALILNTRESTALNRNYFNSHVWKPALRVADVEASRENGMHACRHHYASVLLDAGESIKAVSEYLGHTDPGFTLRTYTHLMPSSTERTRRAVDAALSRVPDVYPDDLARPLYEVRR